MQKRKAQVNFKVPSWEYCNHQDRFNPSRPTKTKCRFCWVNDGIPTCVLDNERLNQQGYLVLKHNRCMRASCGFHTEEIVDVVVDTKVAARIVVDEYRATYKALIDEGYSYIVADKLAREVVLGYD